MIPNNYVEKIYAGYLGMNIGIRLGAPVEPTIWTYERIQNTYGEITGYVKDFKILRQMTMPTALIISSVHSMMMRWIVTLRQMMWRVLGSTILAKASACSGGADMA